MDKPDMEALSMLAEVTAFTILLTQLDPTGCEASHDQVLRCEERARRIARGYIEAKESRR